MKPTISVIMSIYKEPVEWIKLAIDSILNQTFQDFEFIIINDKPDRLENKVMLDEYIQQDKRVRVIHNEQNIGLTRSLNKGLSVAQGEYIVRMDADDISVPNRFEIQLDFMKSHPQFIACGGNIDMIDEKGKTISNGIFASNPNRIKVRAIQHCPLCHPASMFRRVADGGPILYNEQRRLAQDYALWTELLAKGYQITNLRKTLVEYRVSSNHISSKHVGEQTDSKRVSRIVYLKSLGFTTTSIHTIVQLIDKKVSEDLTYSQIHKLFMDSGIKKLRKGEFFKFIMELYCPIRKIGVGKCRTLYEDIKLSLMNRAVSLRSFYYILK